MSRGRPKTRIHNTLRHQISEEWWGREDKTVWPLWLDDILYGIARLDWYGNRENQIPLSTLNILKCLSELDEITTESVMDILGIKQSQAKLYVRACALALPYIERSLNSPEIRRMKYPHVSIAGYEHGIAVGYDKQCRSKICGTERLSE